MGWCARNVRTDGGAVVELVLAESVSTAWPTWAERWGFFGGKKGGGFDLGYLVWCLGARVWVGGMVRMLWFYGIRAEEDLVEEGLVGWGSGDSGASFVYL